MSQSRGQSGEQADRRQWLRNRRDQERGREKGATQGEGEDPSSSSAARLGQEEQEEQGYPPQTQIENEGEGWRGGEEGATAPRRHSSSSLMEAEGQQGQRPSMWAGERATGAGRQSLSSQGQQRQSTHFPRDLETGHRVLSASFAPSLSFLLSPDSFPKTTVRRPDGTSTEALCVSAGEALPLKVVAVDANGEMMTEGGVSLETRCERRGENFGERLNSQKRGGRQQKEKEGQQSGTEEEEEEEEENYFVGKVKDLCNGSYAATFLGTKPGFFFLHFLAGKEESTGLLVESSVGMSDGESGGQGEGEKESRTGGREVKGSPIAVVVKTGPASPSLSFVFGQGAHTFSVAGLPNELVVQAVDLFGNKKESGGDPFVARGLGAAEVLRVADMRDGRYAVQYRVRPEALPGICLVQVTLQGQQVKGSPARPQPDVEDLWDAGGEGKGQGGALRRREERKMADQRRVDRKAFCLTGAGGARAFREMSRDAEAQEGRGVLGGDGETGGKREKGGAGVGADMTEVLDEIASCPFPQAPVIPPPPSEMRRCHARQLEAIRKELQPPRQRERAGFFNQEKVRKEEEEEEDGRLARLKAAQEAASMSSVNKSLEDTQKALARFYLDLVGRTERAAVLAELIKASIKETVDQQQIAKAVHKMKRDWNAPEHDKLKRELEVLYDATQQQRPDFPAMLEQLPRDSNVAMQITELLNKALKLKRERDRTVAELNAQVMDSDLNLDKDLRFGAQEIRRRRKRLAVLRAAVEDKNQKIQMITSAMVKAQKRRGREQMQREEESKAVMARIRDKERSEKPTLLWKVKELAHYRDRRGWQNPDRFTDLLSGMTVEGPLTEMNTQTRRGKRGGGPGTDTDRETDREGEESRSSDSQLHSSEEDEDEDEEEEDEEGEEDGEEGSTESEDEEEEEEEGTGIGERGRKHKRHNEEEGEGMGSGLKGIREGKLKASPSARASMFNIWEEQIEEEEGEGEEGAMGEGNEGRRRKSSVGTGEGTGNLAGEEDPSSAKTRKKKKKRTKNKKNKNKMSPEEEEEGGDAVASPQEKKRKKKKKKQPPSSNTADGTNALPRAPPTGPPSFPSTANLSFDDAVTRFRRDPLVRTLEEQTNAGPKRHDGKGPDVASWFSQGCFRQAPHLPQEDSDTGEVYEYAEGRGNFGGHSRGAHAAMGGDEDTVGDGGSLYGIGRASINIGGGGGGGGEVFSETLDGRPLSQAGGDKAFQTVDVLSGAAGGPVGGRKGSGAMSVSGSVRGGSILDPRRRSSRKEAEKEKYAKAVERTFRILHVAKGRLPEDLEEQEDREGGTKAFQDSQKGGDSAMSSPEIQKGSIGVGGQLGEENGFSLEEEDELRGARPINLLSPRSRQEEKEKKRGRRQIQTKGETGEGLSYVDWWHDDEDLEGQDEAAVSRERAKGKGKRREKEGEERDELFGPKVRSRNAEFREVPPDWWSHDHQGGEENSDAADQIFFDQEEGRRVPLFYNQVEIPSQTAFPLPEEPGGGREGEGMPSSSSSSKFPLSRLRLQEDGLEGTFFCKGLDRDIPNHEILDVNRERGRGGRPQRQSRKSRGDFGMVVAPMPPLSRGSQTPGLVGASLRSHADVPPFSQGVENPPLSGAARILARHGTAPIASGHSRVKCETLGPNRAFERSWGLGTLQAATGTSAMPYHVSRLVHQ